MKALNCTACFIELASEVNTPQHRGQKIAAREGAQVSYHDPHVPGFVHDGLELVGVSDLDAALAEAGCVVIVTDHDDYDWEHVHATARLVVDTRAALRHPHEIPA